MGVVPDLPEYRSHKIVRAAPIVRWSQRAEGTTVYVDVGGVHYTVEAKANIFARGEPKPGDYLVVYDDDYVSWSPKRAFEEGYTRIEGGTPFPARTFRAGRAAESEGP